MVHTNRLARERSPYLLQHAHNPVDWYPWGEEAFARARTEQKPIFLSVGYSTCHWCHVMERESFEDEATAALMNEHFVNVKVDREERPDVDARYMLFVQATTGGGGWPMSVFLTPDLKPFFGGTYFPPQDSSHGVGFPRLLALLASKWREHSGAVAASAERLHESLKKAIIEAAADRPTPSATLDIDSIGRETLGHLARRFDRQHGGFGGAPKFPTPSTLVFLLEVAKAANLKDTSLASMGPEARQQALSMVGKTLEAIWRGGIHDHVGTGIHRYSVDQAWHLPHFEKMLYDQGQLLAVYSEALPLEDRPEMRAMYTAAIRDIACYLQNSLRDPQGAFYCAEDADSLPTPEASRKLEGAFAVWTAEEIDKVLPEQEAALFKSHYGVRPGGNVPAELDHHGELAGKNVLAQQRPLSETAAQFGQSLEECERKLRAARQALLDCRSNRPRPHLDDKILASWNALAISGLCKAFTATRDQSYLALARGALEFIRDNMVLPSGRLIRAYRQEPSSIEGLAVDYVFLTAAALDLWEATLQEDYLTFALALHRTSKELFWEGGSYYMTQRTAKDINLRLRDEHDGAEPAVNSVAAFNLARLQAILGSADRGEERGRECGEMLEALLRSGLADGAPGARPTMVAAALFAGTDPVKVTFMLPASSPLIAEEPLRQLKQIVDRTPIPKVYTVLLHPDDGRPPAVMLCRGKSCQSPVTDPAALQEQLDRMVTKAHP